MIRKALVIYLAGFLVFFVIGYVESPASNSKSSSTRWVGFNDRDFDSGFALWENSNIASSKYSGLEDEIMASSNNYARPGTAPAPEQKYEKVASMGCSSSQYDQTVDSVSQRIKTLGALVQYEENSGVVGRRSMRLAIGIHPEKFEEAVEAFKGIGNLEYFRSDVRDKTNEFRALEAERKTLEAHLESLTEFKSRDGEIDDLIDLQENILNVHEKLQLLGVNLGDFDSENEFCTIRLNVKEKVEVIYESKPWKRVFAGLTWALEYYMYFTLSVLLFSASAYLIVQIVRLIKHMLGMKHISKSDGQ